MVFVNLFSWNSGRHLKDRMDCGCVYMCELYLKKKLTTCDVYFLKALIFCVVGFLYEV